MPQQLDAVEDLVVEPRTPQADHRVDLYLGLVATAVASGAYVLATMARLVPPDGIAIAFFVVPPVAATFALLVLLGRSDADDDQPLRWFCAGLAVGVVAMLLQAIAFPTVSPTGGLLGTDRSSSASLYLLFHVAPPLAAIAGALRWPTRWRRRCVVGGALLAVAFAVNLVPLPLLVRPDGSFTPLLVAVEHVVAGLVLVGAVLWTARTGRTTTALRACVGIALSLMFYDVVFNALGGARFAPVWWASLSMRNATYLVLAVGVIAAVLAELRRTETYGERELVRREDQLEDSLAVTRGLLTATADLSRAVTLTDVLAVTSAHVRAATGAPDAAVALVDPGAPAAHDLVGLVRTDPRLAVLQEPWFTTGRDQVARLVGSAAVPGSVHSLAVVPVVVGEVLLGHVLAWSAHRHSWGALERRLLVGLAEQAGQALVRAQAFEGEARAARTLQQSLLPSALPTLDRLRLGATYRPGELGSTVGGDWYDCIRIDDDRVALVIGDVMGKGLRAAAVMGQVRTAVRSVAATNPSPVAVLESLDEVALDLGGDEIVTLIYVLVDLRTGSARVARAGHLPFLVLDPDGTASVSSDGGSTPLGAPDPERVEARFRMAPGGAFVLFTDGLVEDRAHPIDVGIERLATRVSGLHSLVVADPQAAAARLVDTGAGAEVDDLAVLVAAFG